MNDIIHGEPISDADAMAIWAKRTRDYGARCAINLNHPESEFDAVTQQQTSHLLPLLKSNLVGTEKTVLDFGCGPGRFSASLAQLIGDGRVIAFDICEELIALAPQSPSVRYISGTTDDFFQKCTDRFDVLWICHVLGGIPETKIPYIANKLSRITNPNGVLFLVEHVDRKNHGNKFWKSRSPFEYARLFSDFDLKLIDIHHDLGQEIVVMVGRKYAYKSHAGKIIQRLRRKIGTLLKA